MGSSPLASSCCGARYLPAPGGLVAALLDVPSRYDCGARSSGARLGDDIARLATLNATGHCHDSATHLK
jgi:hypothetical protein